jgi:hypothetical protein
MMCVNNLITVCTAPHGNANEIAGDFLHVRQLDYCRWQEFPAKYVFQRAWVSKSVKQRTWGRDDAGSPDRPSTMIAGFD